MCSNPNYDIEAFEDKLRNHVLKQEFTPPTKSDADTIRPVLDDLLVLDKNFITSPDLQQLFVKHKLAKYQKNSFVLQSAYLLQKDGIYTMDEVRKLQNLLRTKRIKSHSGILSVTIFTSPYPTYIDKNGTRTTQGFTCSFDCAYCPNEPDQPRSYLLGEPGVLRANRNRFDAVEQMWSRLHTLHIIGHDTMGSKLEIIILGGTFTSYPKEYIDEFIRDIYYAANTYHVRGRERDTLAVEKNINRDATCRVIGLTCEMRPDSITKNELYRLRGYGCTRVQLGVQHLDNTILKAINRKCTTERFVKSLKLLKDSCFKVDIHIMPNLPFSSPELDRKMMLEDFLGQTTDVVETTKDGIDHEDYDISRPDLSADQWKIYPCETVPYTKIEEWFRDGSYQPYAKDDLYNLLFDVKTNMYPWIRTNRIVRDIPKGYIIASSDEPNTSQILLDDLKSRNIQCMCIRCREVKENKWDGRFTTVVRHYKASDGDEYFISAESEDKKTLYGFIRLRLVMQSNPIFPELHGCGLIRELHVYSNMSSVCSNIEESVQHKGVGKCLVANAERISASNGYRRMAIIAGIGVQRYYEKLGYNIDETSGEFMTRQVG